MGSEHENLMPCSDGSSFKALSSDWHIDRIILPTLIVIGYRSLEAMAVRVDSSDQVHEPLCNFPILGRMIRAALTRTRRVGTNRIEGPSLYYFI